MKRKFPFRAEAALFAFVLSLCAAACPVTAFPLNASLPRIALVLALFSLLCGFALSLRHGVLIPLGAMALGSAWLWLQSDIVNQTESLLLALTGRYTMAYNTPVLCLWAENGANGNVELPLMVLGILAVFLVCLTLAKGLSPVFMLAALSVMPLSCIVVTDTVPHPAAIFGLIGGLVLLFLTSHYRLTHADSRLTGLLLLPVALALGGLFLVFPEADYVNHVPEYQAQIMAWVEEIAYYGEALGDRIVTGQETGTAEKLNLRSLGPRIQRDYPVMEVTAPISGPLYLRGQDYDGYTGTGWTASRHRNETFSCPGIELGQLTITTRSTRSIRYVPYYPAGELTLASGRLANDGEKTYSYTLINPIDPFQISADISDLLIGAHSPWSDTSTWHLSESTLEWAEPLAQSITAGCADTEAAVQAIADFVRSSAVYALDTGKMETSQQDFARWFLEESDTGYCVHFATATTVLLRALDIPARYVEGYLVQAEAGQPVTVSAKAAHAWAECYVNGRWQVVEATPADPEEESPTQTVLPPETEPEQPTLPSRQEEALPSESTAQPENLPDSDDAPSQTPSFTLPGWVRWIPRLALGILLLWGQSELRLRRKKRLWSRGSANERALTRYRQLSIFSKALELPMPEALEALAQKAKFSQHCLTRSELQLFDAFRSRCKAQLQSLSPIRRIILRLIFAIG